MLVLIDNYDSFTYNLVHYFQEIGQKVRVYRNDEISINKVFELKPKYLVISPGPSTPSNSGICPDLLIQNSKNSHVIPTLGVCLGHQVIAECFNSKVIQSGKPVHGKISKIFHKNSKLYKNISNPFNATRYHSLIVDKKSVRDDLVITADTQDKVVMGLEHRTMPIYGVQFHPESIATEDGHQLLRNFLDNNK
ncbi:MAG: anthranilate synthase component II [Alphaproteobacteria bacterium]|tara:strand:- start:267 stop:845 length:579 start_codon:yes stop_codon:yes gene_type:complete